MLWCIETSHTQTLPAHLRVILQPCHSSAPPTCLAHNSESSERFPQLEDAQQLASPLAQHPQLATKLTDRVREALAATVDSELWPDVAREVVTWQQVAQGCVWGLFMSLQLHVRVLGAWRAHAPEALRETFRQQQAVGDYTITMVKEWWEGLSKEQQAEHSTSREAATTLFTNPPVALNHGQLTGACMRVRTTAHHIHPPRKNGYPELILQQEGNGLRKVSVPCHVLVACIFLGVPTAAQRAAEKTFVCHNDEPADYPAADNPEGWHVKWAPGFEQPPAGVAPGTQVFPRLAMCGSKHCVNPLCLHYSSQEDNCSTAHKAHYKVCKKQRQKWTARL